EPPTEAEGFASVVVERFVRRPDPARRAAGVIVDLDAVPLEAARALGPVVAATAWLPGVTSADEARRRLGLEAELERAWCPHPAGPFRCWCRKPMPGLGVVLAARLGLDAARTICVGGVRAFAARLGMGYSPATDGGRTSGRSPRTC